jgi:hypothetical protein
MLDTFILKKLCLCYFIIDSFHSFEQATGWRVAAHDFNEKNKLNNTYPLQADNVGIVLGVPKKKIGMSTYSFTPATYYASYFYRPLLEDSAMKSPYALARRAKWWGAAAVSKSGSTNVLQSPAEVNQNLSNCIK